MPVQQFLVELLEDVIVSQRSATAGEHSGLNYLPGAKFLGAVADYLSDWIEENPEPAQRAFFSGQVRFHNALPLVLEDNKCYFTYPIPICLHHEKGDDKDQNILNYQHDERFKEQAEQYRDKYVSSTGIIKESIKKQFRMKTAVNPETGIAADTQLFGYSSLSKGQKFSFQLEADDTVEAGIFDQIVKKLTDKTLYIGRSRSAEYGKVRITPIIHDALSKPTVVKNTVETSNLWSVNLWLLADAALQDEYGQPLLTPTAESVGLPKYFKFKPEKSFTRSRRYTPFNGKRQRRELERVVLTAGSVLYFESEQEIDINTLEKIQACGIGNYRQVGLGRVWVNPELLKKREPCFSFLDVKSFVELSPAITKPEKSALFDYLSSRENIQDEIEKIEKVVDVWIDELKTCYKSAKSFETLAIDKVSGPSPTQWGQVMDVIEKQRKLLKNQPMEKAVEEIWIELKKSVCKETDEQWSKQFYSGGKVISFCNWLEEIVFTKQVSDSLRLKMLSRFAHTARDTVQKMKNQKKEQFA